MDRKYVQSELESIIIFNIRPHFLIIEYENEFFHIIISHPRYKGVTISNRISEIFSLINTCNKSILNKYLLIVQCFDPEEMNEVLEYIL